MKMCFKFVKENMYRTSDDEIRSCKTVSILYGFDNYKCDLIHISELKSCIIKDYPEYRDNNIKVEFILPHESTRHARQTMLSVAIPADDFIKLRKDREIHIL